MVLVAGGARIRLLDPVRDYLRCRGKSALEGWHTHLLGACRVSKVGDRRRGEMGGECQYWNGSYGGRHFMHHLNGCNGKLGVGSLGAIKTLDLDSCELGEAGAACLASALERNATLQWLSLDRNGMGAAGAASLASALEKNATLRYLSLEINNMGDAGAASLASALEKNDALHELILNSNDVGDVGAASLASALENNATLQPRRSALAVWAATDRTFTTTTWAMRARRRSRRHSRRMPRCRSSTLTTTAWAMLARRRSRRRSSRMPRCWS